MPYFDGTGPRGMGPMTGRRFGPCGYGRRLGYGRRFGWGYWQNQPDSEPLAKEEERKILEAELREIESEKNEIEKRLKGIK